MAVEKQTASQMAEYIQLTDGLIREFKEANDQLTEELSRHQKTASAQLQPLDVDAVSQTVDNIIRAGFIKKAEREDARAAISRNPSTLLTFLDKLAAQHITQRESVAAPLGKAVGQAPAPAGRESDRVFEERFNGFRA